MKTLLRTLFVGLFIGAVCAAQAPNRLFDVRNGNGTIDGATTYARAVVIPFKDAASEQKIIDSFATAYGYQATIADPANPGQTIPNPQSKKQFFMRQLTRYINDVHRAEVVKTAAKTAGEGAGATADGELPPQ